MQNPKLRMSGAERLFWYASLAVLALLLVGGFFVFAQRRMAAHAGEVAPLISSAQEPTNTVADEPPGTQVPADARAFVIVKHEKFGYLVLHGYKKRKGEHGQIPGGRIDSGEDGVTAAVRELFEETGILVTKNRVRSLWPIGTKYFYYVVINDDDQTIGGTLPVTGEQFRLKLSEEHVGYSFYKNLKDAAKAVILHSGGTPARALERLELEAV